MSFLSDVFHGNFGNVGQDLFGSPTAIAETVGAIAAPFAIGALAPAALGALGPAAGEAASAWGPATFGGLGAATSTGADVGAAGGALGFGSDVAGTPTAGTFFQDASFTGADAAVPGAPISQAPLAEADTGSVFGFNPEGTGNLTPAQAYAAGVPDPSQTAPADPLAGYPTDTELGVGSAAPGGGTGAPFNFDPGYGIYNNGVQTGIQGVGPVAAPGGDTSGLPSWMNLKNLSAVGGVGALGYNLYQGYQQQQQLKALQQQETDYQNQIAAAGTASLNAAQPMLATGQALMTGGPVPAPMQAILDNYRSSARAGIIQGYASRGQSADPTQNSALQQDLAKVDQNVMALREQIGQQIVSTANTMLTQGASATNIAAQLPLMMQRLNIQLQQLSSSAIANFAAAVGGGTMKNINVNQGASLVS